MPNDLIAAKFVAYKELSDQGNKEVDAILHETPFERAKREIQEQLEKNQQYRAVILKNVTTFAGLPQSSIETAARSMEEVYYKKGDKIIEQDDIGDSFFVLEEGFVSVTRKTNTKDPTEHPRELARLGKNSFFGEISLLTAEPRSATITVLSDEAKCLRMTKMQFDSLLSTTNQIIEENRKQIGQSVLEAVPLFKSMTMVNKRKLLEAMIPMTYMPGSYICRQGTTGNTFFILTEGTCKVTVNSSEQNEKEVARLHPGDFFGEVALIETSNRRTANVISVDSVSCLTLSRNDFNRLLKNFKVKLMEHQAMRASNTDNKQDANAGAIKQMNSLANKRRISGYNTIGQRDEVRISSLLRRLMTFLTESLWNSMYHRLYRDILLDPTHCNEYGKVAVNIISTTNNRFEAVTEIQEQALRILEMDPPRRTAVDHAFILGLLKQRNHLRDRLCKMWPPHQFALLAKKVKLVRFRYLRKIVEVDTKGTCAFMILRGSVRIFTRVQRGDGHLANPNEAYSKTFYEEDLFPGEVFGEAALSGMHTRMLTALSMTNVDLLVIEDEDFLSAQDRDSVHMGTEEKSKFLAQVPMFRVWDSYKLLRLAHVLVQEDIENHVVITRNRAVSKDLYFIVNGKVDILDSLRKKHVVTTLQNGDYFGESGFCNRFVKAISSKVTEEFYAVSATKLEVLVLHEANFLLFDMSSVDLVRQSFLAKQEWRRERVKIMKMERAKVRRQYHVMNVEAHYLPQLRKQEAKEKEAAEKHRRKMLGDHMDSDDDDDDEASGGDGKRSGGHRGRTDADDGDVSGDDDADPNHEAMGEYGGYTLYRPKKTLGGNDSRDHIYANIRPESGARRASSPTAAHGSGGKPRSTPGSPSNSPGKSRPSSPNKKPPSKADVAYQSSLVHPLDTRLQNPLLWRPPPRPKDRVRNLEDIPAILNKEFDLLMVSAACRDARTLQKSQELILAAKRPLTAKARLQKQQLMNQPLPAFDANASTTSSAVASGASGQGSGQAPTPPTAAAAATTTTTTVVVSKMKEIMASQNIIDRRFHSDGNLETAGTHPDLLTPEEEEALTDVERAAYRRKVEAMRRKSLATSQLVGGFRKSYANLLSPGGGGGGGEAKGGEAAPPKGGRDASPPTPSSRKKSVTIFEDDLAEGSRSLGGGESLTEVDEDTNNMEDDDEVQFYIKSLRPALHRQSSAPPKYFQQQAQQDALAAATAAVAAAAAGEGYGRGRPMSGRPTTARLQRQGSQKRPASALPSAMKTPTTDAGATSADAEATGAAPSATLSGRSTILSAPRPQTAPSHRRTSTSPTPSSPAAGLRFDPTTANGNYVTSPGAVTRSTLHLKASPFRRPSAQQPSSNPNDNLHVNLPTIPPANNRFGQGLQILPASPVPRAQGRPSSAQFAANNNNNHSSNRFAVSNNTSVGYPLRLLSALDASYDDSMEHGGSLPSHSLTGHSAQGVGVGVREPARLHNVRPGEGGGMPTGGLLNKARMAGPSPLLHDRPHRR